MSLREKLGQLGWFSWVERSIIKLNNTQVDSGLKDTVDALSDGLSTLTNEVDNTKADVASVQHVIDEHSGRMDSIEGTLSNKANTNHSHTFASLSSKPTTISEYGITDSYTKTEIDTQIGNISTILASL